MGEVKRGRRGPPPRRQEEALRILRDWEAMGVEGVTISALARALESTRQSTRTLVGKLESKGLVARRPLRVTLRKDR